MRGKRRAVDIATDRTATGTARKTQCNMPKRAVGYIDSAKDRGYCAHYAAKTIPAFGSASENGAAMIAHRRRSCVTYAQGHFFLLSKTEREEKLAALGEFVERRDGISDFSKRTLSHREETLRRFEEVPVLYDGPLDPSHFEAQYRHFDKRRKTPREILLKFNYTEAFAVEQSFRAVEQGLVRPKNPLELVLLLEEHYHTKIFPTAARLFGLTIAPRVEASAAVAFLNTAMLRLRTYFRLRV